METYIPNKIGVGITTYETPHYLDALYDSIPHDKIDELVIVNGGSPYERHYDKADMIQHCSNHYPSVCRNDAAHYLKRRGCEHIFLIEDDMVIKDETIFDQYILAANTTNLCYLCFASTSWHSGEPGNRTPAAVIEYNEDVSIALYPNMCNEFTYHHYDTFQPYDEEFRYIFDIDSAYRYSQLNMRAGAPFWWFADLPNSDDLIMNNPETESRINAGGARDDNLKPEWIRFAEKHGKPLNDIEKFDIDKVKTHLKKIAQ